MLEIVLGTRNAKKRRELELLLNPYPVQLRTLDEFPHSIEVAETGDSFHANAALKATQQAVLLNRWVLGEDSGLSVLALDGQPGIYSARFSGEGATDQSNNALLLEKLQGLSRERRRAFYTCHMTLSDPQGNQRINTVGICHGFIREFPSGQGGFGYDPLFELPEYHLTFAELGDGVKSVLSHRARAARQFVRQLVPLIDQLTATQTSK